jgi:hypothetical protein
VLGQRLSADGQLAHKKIENMVRYLGIEVDDALAIAEPILIHH